MKDILKLLKGRHHLVLLTCHIWKLFRKHEGTPLIPTHAEVEYCLSN